MSFFGQLNREDRVTGRHLRVAFLIITALFVAIGTVILLSASNNKVYFTVDSLTDSVELINDEAGETLVLRLPQASYFFEDPDKDFEITEKQLEHVATVAISSPGTAVIETLASGKISVRANTPDEGATIRVSDATGFVHEADVDAYFEVNCALPSCTQIEDITLNAQLTSMQIGRFQSEWIEPESPGFTQFNQPHLVSGALLAHKPATVYGNQFDLMDAELRRGDVLNFVGEDDPVIATIAISVLKQEAGRIHVVAHTHGRNLEVKRFGGGYNFGVAAFTAWSKQPIWQLIWITLVSVFVILSFMISTVELLTWFGTPGDASGGAKDKRKGHGDASVEDESV